MMESASPSQVPRMVKRLIAWPHRWLMGRLIRALARRTEHCGFAVYDATRNGLGAGELQTLKRALSLISEAAPETYSRVVGDMPAITVVDDDRLEYAHVMRSAFLPRKFVAESPHVTIAAILVGLGARAHVSHMPGGWMADTLAKPRLLRVDVDAQRTFVANLDPERYTNTQLYLEYLHRLRAQLSGGEQDG